jgi:putative transposase
VFDQRHPGKVAGWQAQQVVLPKLGAVKLAQPDRLPSAMPKLITLRRDGAGRFFIAFGVEYQPETLPVTGVSLGVDVGIKSLAVDSQGAEYPNAKALAGRLKHLRRQQRSLSRKQGARKGEKQSNRYRRQARRVARLHCRIADGRQLAQNQASAALVAKADVICLETLRVKNMMQNGRLARSLADAGISELHRQIEYKAAWAGRQVKRTDPWSPTSKTCSCCGYKLKDLSLSTRAWQCPECGAKHDRDVNAARNILSFCTAGNAEINARGLDQNLVANTGSPGLPTIQDETRTECGHAWVREDRSHA